MHDIWQELKGIIKKRHIPIEFVLELTRRCNLRCCHCYNIKDNAELSFDQIKEITRQLRKAGCLFLVLTGGEVFTIKNFLDIAFFIRDAGFDIKIFTNGTLIDKKTSRVLDKIAPSEIGVTIQAACASVHDRITGVKGSFERSLSAVRILKEEGLPVHIKCTLMKQNFKEYEKVIKLARSMDIAYLIDPIISPKDNGSKDILAYRLSAAQLKEFYKSHFLETQDVKEDNYLFCEAGRTFGCISAEGIVYPCVQLPMKLGNIFRQEFDDIWNNSPILKKIRVAKWKDIRSCADCKLAKYCYRCIGLAYLEDGDMFGPSSVACLNTKLYNNILKDVRVNEVKITG
jgi:radical SAM protein with 4Fe4S-binding SPASM domain